MSKDLSSKVVLITGCSSGFGLLTAARLATKGYSVVATMRNMKKKEALLSEVTKRGGKLKVVALDVTDNRSIQKAIEYVTDEYGYIDVLINNAGYGIGGAFEDLSNMEFRDLMETNFFGVLNVTRQSIPLMRNRPNSKIINISSAAGFSTSPCFSAYNCSKWALEAFSESLRYELQMFDIDVLLVQPGSYKTKIFYENRRYAKNFDNEQSPYYEMSNHIRKRLDGYLDDLHKDPEEVPELIERLIKRLRPRFRNIPDLESKLQYIFRRILPFRIYSWIIRKAFLGGLKQS